MNYNLSVDDILIQQKIRNKKKIRIYKKVLEKCYHRIKFASKKDIKWCFFVVPNYIVGTPLYNVNACIIYVIKQLERGGFLVKYTHPNLIYISWNKQNHYDFNRVPNGNGIPNTNGIPNGNTIPTVTLRRNSYENRSISYPKEEPKQIKYFSSKPEISYKSTKDYKPKGTFTTPYNEKKIEDIDRKMDYLFKDLD